MSIDGRRDLRKLRIMAAMFLLMAVGIWNTGLIVKAQYRSEGFDEANLDNVTFDGIYVSEDGTYEMGYQYINKEVKIVGFNIKNANTSVVIPSEIDGKKVTAIGNPLEIPPIAMVGVLDYCNDIISIKFPDTLTSIDHRTFFYCSNLKTVDIPASVREIGEYAFTGTKWMENKQNESPFVIVNNILIDGSTCTGEITIPKGVTAIGNYAFSTLKTSRDESTGTYSYPVTEYSSVTKVTCNTELKTIGDYAFSGCNSLTAVTFNDGLENIGERAFYSYNVSNLDNVVLPDTIKNVGYQAFSGTKFSTSITPVDGLWISNGILLGVSVLPASGELVIPDSVRVIEDSAFSSLSSSITDRGLTSITIPGTVEKIPYNAFSGCKNLISVTMNEGVKVIDFGAFQGCSALKTVSIPQSVTSIGDAAFWSCSELDNISIPSSVTSIGYDAFSECSQLKTVTIPSTVTSIGSRAFDNTKWLDNKRNTEGQVIVNGILIDATTCSGEVVIPDTVTSINSDAFNKNTTMTSVTIPEGKVDSIGRMFSGCTGLQSINLPKSVTEISYGAFSDCTSLTAINVTEDNPVYSSSDGILYDKNKTELLTYPAAKGGTYTMPETVTTVAANAFDNCDNLEKVILSSKVDSVSPNAFGTNNDDTDTKINVKVPEDMDVSGVGLENIKASKHVIIYVADGSSAYLYLKDFDMYITVMTYPSKNGTKNENNTNDSKENNTSDTSNGSNGKSGSNDDTVPPVPPVTPVPPENDNTDAEIGKTYEAGSATYKVTSATEVSFTAPKDKSIKKITIPATVTIMNKSYNVTSVAKGACKGCKKLTTVTVGKNVKSIGDEAFMNCIKLKKMTVGKNVTTIGKKVFSGDKKLKRLIFKGAKVKKVGKKALSKVPKKVKITAPKKAVSKYKKLLNKAK